MTDIRLTKELDIAVVKSGSSWGTVFAAAASVKLEEVDDDFLQRTQSSATPLAGMAELAKKSNNCKRERKEETVVKDVNVPPGRKKRKKEKVVEKAFADSTGSGDEEPSSSSPVLEGQMANHPVRKDEQFMVLVDKKNKIVYDAMRRSDEGEMLRVGKLSSKGKIRWKESAFEDETKAEDETDRDTFPFPTDPDDHCESPLEAYSDIVDLMTQLFPKKDECLLYDPYYCDGATERNLNSLGFPRVHNVKEDCYKVWSSGTCPKFDALITNPPYSEDHIPKLIEYLTSPMMQNKPWFLLMPQWVSKKPYFVEIWDKKALFLVPKKRYVYVPPKDFREKKASDVHKKSSPFVSIWFIWGGSKEKTNMLHDYYRAHKQGGTCLLARSKNGLRDLRRQKKK